MLIEDIHNLESINTFHKLYHKYCKCGKSSHQMKREYPFNDFVKMLTLASFTLTSQHGSHWTYRHKDLSRNPQFMHGVVKLIGRGSRKNRKISGLDAREACNALHFLIDIGAINDEP